MNVQAVSSKEKVLTTGKLSSRRSSRHLELLLNPPSTPQFCGWGFIYQHGPSHRKARRIERKNAKLRT